MLMRPAAPVARIVQQVAGQPLLAPPQTQRAIKCVLLGPFPSSKAAFRKATACRVRRRTATECQLLAPPFVYASRVTPGRLAWRAEPELTRSRRGMRRAQCVRRSRARPQHPWLGPTASAMLAPRAPTVELRLSFSHNPLTSLLACHAHRLQHPDAHDADLDLHTFRWPVCVLRPREV